MIAIILFAAMEAANMLGFSGLTLFIGAFIGTAANILFGLIVFGIGLYLSGLAHRVILNTGTSQAGILATAARAAILIFSGALALRQMGIGEDIVNMAFGLLLGAVAVAAALAFGLGGRDTAARLLERWRNEIRIDLGRTPPPPPSANRPAESPGLGTD